MNGGYNHGGNDTQGWIYYDNSGNSNNIYSQQPQQQQMYLQNISMQSQFPMHQIPPGLAFNQGGVYQGPVNSYPHINFMQSSVAVNSAMTTAHMMGGGSCCSGYATGGSQHLSQSSGFLTQGSGHLSQSSGPLQNSLASGSSQQKAKGFRYGTEEKVIGSEDDKTSCGSGAEEGLIEHLELSKFKCQICPNQNIQHNHKQCQFYHGLKDRRRVGVTYSSDQCQYIDSLGANCPLGDRCPKSHNKVEQLYCSDKYKTKFCTHYPNDCRSCEYGEFCSFAHSESDINAELIHNYEFDADFYVFRYKTVWCPFNYINHDRGICVYAHNWQDYRRKPNSSENPYEPESCSSWEPNSFITDYELGCPNKQSCNKCHGWKELEYHPKIYRTKPCMQQQQCSKAKACPFYHNQAEKRVLSMNIQSELFRYAPKNRITKGLFKASQSVIPREIKQQQQQQGSASMNSSAVNQSKQGLFSSTSSQPSSGSYGQMQSDGNHGSIGVSVGSSQFRKQNSLNQKKGRVNSALTKMSTCHDLSSKLVEEFSQPDINSSKGREGGEEEEEEEEEKKEILSTVHSPILKKPTSNSSTGGTNRITFKRCESQSIDDNSSEESETPKQDVVPPQQLTTSLQTLDSTTNGSIENQGGLRKSIKITSPFVLEGEAESSLVKIKQPTQTTLLSSDKGYSPAIQLAKEEEDQREEDEETQQDKPHSPFNQFDNAFSQPMQQSIPSQNKEMQIPLSFNQLGGYEHNDIQRQNQQQTSSNFNNNQLTAKPTNNNLFNQSNNTGNSNNQNGVLQKSQSLSKPFNHNQDEEDFNHINSLIDNIL